MKFGKTYETAYDDIALSLPAFPYRALKKMLNAALEREGADAHIPFFAHLTSVTRKLDAKWRGAVRRVLLAIQLPTTLSHALLGKRDVHVHAAALAAWAGLTREALRKILKKFNKRVAQHCTCGTVQIFSQCSLGFMASNARTQIEALGLPPTDAKDAVDCPVCLEVLYQPVTLRECGHAMCRHCFDGLSKRAPFGRDVLGHRFPVAKCPICRAPASAAVAAPALQHVARATRTDSFNRRKGEAAAEAERKLEEKFGRHVKAHPMALMLGPQ